jgi:signal transduction histidine kinase
MKRRFRFIVLAFAISFIVMVFLSFYSIRQFSSLGNYSDQVDHTNHVITELYKIQDIVKEIDVKERGFMLTKDSAYLQELFGTAFTLYPLLRSLKEHVKENKEQKRTFTMLSSAIALRISNFKDNINYIDSSHASALSPFYSEGKKFKSECIARINEMLARENSLLSQRFRTKKYYQQITSDTIRYLLLTFFILTIVLFLLMIHELRQRIVYQDELQAKLLDLTRSHSELEEIAFAASHDLQEPLRKMRIFSNRLIWLKKEGADDDETNNTVERINSAAARMQELIDDMVNLTSLIKEEGDKELVDLNLVLKDVLTELDPKIAEEKANIFQEVLPEITGYKRQFHMLFKSLLDNSLKFTRPGVQPVISIRADVANGEELMEINDQLASQKFHRITISDNGIGFDNKFINKMFRMFQRLHNEESGYEGKGIGLAICQRIMVNHKGYIIAYGHPEVGATFKLFFPAEN